MTPQQVYRWDFDRSAWDSRADAATFSVGVYAWVPKASGNGLRKSKTIRVLGYVADANAVYEKAEELCRRLNREKARPDALPGWVQKQYSVAKPQGYEIPRRSPQITGGEARKIRAEVVKERLLPIGFRSSHASTFVRRAGEIVQVVYFQTHTSGGMFIMNVGLHYMFTPPGGELKSKRWTSFELGDCSLQHQLGPWHDFGEDPAALRVRFAGAIRQSVRVLDRHTKRLADPASVLSQPHKWVAPFYVQYPTLFCASIEMRLGRLAAADKRLREQMPCAELEAFYRPKHRRLLRLTDQLRNARGDGKRTAKLLEWVRE